MIKRVHARICIVLIALCLTSLVLVTVFSTSYPLCAIIFACTGLLFFIASIVVRIILLRCPACGKTATRPRWTKSETLYCPKCGKPFEYDR